jgi:hypothetical protein
LTVVVACIDGSAYDNSVCDHALWLADPLEASIEILRPVQDARTDSGSRPERRALGRLLDEGAGEVRIVRRDGDLLAQLAASHADMVVMGKRGRGAGSRRGTIGAQVVPVLEKWPGPVCLASHVFLPVHKALVLMDAEPDHQLALELICSHARFRDLPLDVAIIAGDPQAARRKREQVLSRLGERPAAVIEIPGPGLTDALVGYMQSRSADIFVISRPVLFPDAEARLRRLENCGLWAWRTPVLVC